MAEITACPYAKKCGGCRYIGSDYEKTLEIKKKKVEKMLGPEIHVRGIVGMEDPYHYRNKAHWAFQPVWDGKRIRHEAGIYKEGTHKVVPIRECLIEDEEADSIMRDALMIARKYKMKIYDEDTGEGLLRHVLVRTAHATGEIMVVLILASPVFPGKNNFVKLLRAKHPRISTIVINVNDQKTSMVLGERNITAFGRGYIIDELCGKKFHISPNSFYQVNPVQTEKLYGEALRIADLHGKETVIDAYSGIGTVGIIAAAHAGQVTGIELNPAAVRDARTNAKINGIRNASFIEGDAGEYLDAMAADRARADVIFMDPPRSGASERFIRSAAAARPSRIVYISCEPETLARDLAEFRRLGYRAKEAMAFDMFPFTENIEVVLKAEREKRSQR